MKKRLLIIGILLIAIAVVLFLLAAMWHFVAYNTMDGSADMFYWQIRMMWIHLGVGVVAAIAGVISLILRNRH